MIAVLSIGIYLMFILKVVPGAAEQRLGVLEPLPADLGKWRVDQDSPEATAAASEGLLREERYVFSEATGLFSQGRLALQVRYRNRETGDIVRVDPEQQVKRRRLKQE